jgi:hypothetical protein
MRRARIVRDDSHDVLRESLFFAGITWLPFAILGLTSRPPAGAGPSLLVDLSAHARCLLAIPSFFAAERITRNLSESAIEHFEAGHFVDRGHHATLRRDVDRARRLRDNTPVELCLLLVALLHGQAVLWGGYTSAFAFYLPLTTPRLSTEGIWYALVSLPAFLFLFLRMIYQWLIWSWLLWRMSRHRLHLVTTHPDLAGGLQFLSEPTRGFALFFFGVSCVVAGAWETRLWLAGLPLETFGPQLVALVVIAEVGALGPLLPFCGKLLHARIEGLRAYSAFALGYSRVFREQYLFARTTKEALVESSPVQGLADVGNVYQCVRKTRLVPFAREDTLRILVAALAPMLILVLSVVPIDRLMLGLLHAFFGGG